MSSQNENRNQFMKINIINTIGNVIVNIGVQNGFKELPDIVDLNCGAVPEGGFEDVIDLSAPEQFLSLYTNVAEKRFAMAVTLLVNAHEGFFKLIQDFCNQAGKDLKAGATNAQNAFDLINNVILDGMPCDQTKEIVFETPEKVEWVKKIDTHQNVWSSVGGDINLYYNLLKAFVEGLLDGSGVSFTIEDNSKFILSK